jgi:methionyl-tRNA formyltransferase
MEQNNKYIFFGTPEFAAIILEKLIEAGFAPTALICNPDRPVGRKKIITAPPTKILAQKHGITVWQPEGLKIENWKLKIEELGGIDFAVVAAYSQIIPKNILDVLPAKFMGVHPSLLPRHRGASPIQSAILEGDEVTGVTLYLLDEKMDHGPILAGREFSISNFKFSILQTKLAEMAGNMLVETLPKFMKGEIKPQVQNEKYATYTKKFTTDDAFVDLEKDDPVIIERKVRALNPEPGVWTLRPLDVARDKQAQGKLKRMKILEAELKDGKLVLKKIQFEGKKPQELGFRN